MAVGGEVVASVESAAVPDVEPVRWVVPLGSNCLPATWLQQRGLRKFALPFDWAFTSPAIVRDCLADDFKSFLEPREYVAIGRRGTGAGHRRYSPMRLPGRWQDFVFLHHDPLRKRQDYEYLRRSVQRFRTVMASSGRKLLLHCHVVESEEALRSVRDGAGAAEKPSWARCSAAEVELLFRAICDRGVRDFHLVAVTLCVGAASKAEAAPRRCIRRRGATARGESYAVHEVHLVRGHGSEEDPLHFFGEGRNEEAFEEAVLAEAAWSEGEGAMAALGSLPKWGRRSFDLGDSPDGRGAQGYRDASPAREAAPPQFACGCCGEGLASRNRLFAHLRSTPSCAAAAAALRAPGGEPQVLAVALGYDADAAEGVEARLAEALAASGATEVRTLLRAAPTPCAAAQDVVLVACRPALLGEALLEALRRGLGAVRVHGIARQPRNCVSELEEGARQTYAWVLPASSLLAEGGSSALVSSPPEGARREAYRRFKAVLREVLQRSRGQSGIGEAEAKSGEIDLQAVVEQCKMAERVELGGAEFVVVRIARHGLSPRVCLDLITEALTRHHELSSGAEERDAACARHALYLESVCFRRYEARHGPMFPGLQDPQWLAEFRLRLIRSGAAASMAA